MGEEHDPIPARTTQELAHSISAGDLARFEELYQRVAPALFAWARLRLLKELRGRVEPEDLLQEVWIRTLNLFERFDPEKGRFRPWIFSIAKMVLLEATRRLRSGPVSAPTAFEPADLPESVTSITSRLARDEGVSAFLEHVEHLEPEDQRLLVAFGLEQQSGEEVARQLGIARDTAYKRWQRLRQELRTRGIGAEVIED